MQLSEQEIIRRQSLKELEKLGINPYPAELFEINVSAANIHEHYTNQKIEYKDVSIAGRLMSRRIMGNASFAELQDETGRIHVGCNVENAAYPIGQCAEASAIAAISFMRVFSGGCVA